MSVFVVNVCTACGQPAEYSGMFIPHNSQRFGAVSGKQRVIFYNCCEQCKQDPKRIEDVLLRRATVQERLN